MSSIFYFFRESLTGFTRNLSTTLGSIITIFLSLLIIGIFCIAGAVVNNVVASVENQVSITAYVKDDASDADIEKVMKTIEGYDGVESVSFTTKDQALDNFRKSTSNPEIVDQLDGENPLPASIDVQLDDAQSVQNIASEILANQDFVDVCDNADDPTDSLQYGQKTVDKLFSLTNAIRYRRYCSHCVVDLHCVHLYQQHYSFGNSCASQGNRHHASGWRLEWLHSGAFLGRRCASCFDRCFAGDFCT